MDYVYICGPGESEELRYSIRSVEKNAAVDSIWVVGQSPDWYCGNKIDVPYTRGNKYRNARSNLKAITESKDISDPFVLMNDDFFIVRKQTRVGYNHGGLLKDRVLLYQEIAPHSSYTAMLNETYFWLIRNGIKDPLDYELHVPMVMEKDKLFRALGSGVLWRSTYGNMNNVGGEQMQDVKVYLSKSFEAKTYNFKAGTYPYVSTDNDSFEMVKKDLLGDMLDKPSKYELPST